MILHKNCSSYLLLAWREMPELDVIHCRGAAGIFLNISYLLLAVEETCGLGLAMEHNGDLFSCDHFVEPKNKLGNISKIELIDMVQSHKQYQYHRLRNGLQIQQTLSR